MSARAQHNPPCRWHVAPNAGWRRALAPARAPLARAARARARTGLGVVARPGAVLPGAAHQVVRHFWRAAARISGRNARVSTPTADGAACGRKAARGRRAVAPRTAGLYRARLPPRGKGARGRAAIPMPAARAACQPRAQTSAMRPPARQQRCWGCSFDQAGGATAAQQARARRSRLRPRRARGGQEHAPAACRGARRACARRERACPLFSFLQEAPTEVPGTTPRRVAEPRRAAPRAPAEVVTTGGGGRRKGDGGGGWPRRQWVLPHRQRSDSAGASLSAHNCWCNRRTFHAHGMPRDQDSAWRCPTSALNRRNLNHRSWVAFHCTTVSSNAARPTPPRHGARHAQCAPFRSATHVHHAAASSSSSPSS